MRARITANIVALMTPADVDFNAEPLADIAREA